MLSIVYITAPFIIFYLVTQSTYIVEAKGTVPFASRVLKPEGAVIITLSDGKGEETWNGIRTMLEQQLIPAMQQNGFKNIELVRGPNSRQYHTVSVKGEK